MTNCVLMLVSLSNIYRGRTHSDVLVGKVSDLVQYASSDVVTQFLNSNVLVDVTQVDSSVPSLVHPTVFSKPGNHRGKVVASESRRPKPSVRPRSRETAESSRHRGKCRKGRAGGLLMLSGDSVHRLGLGLSNGILLGFRNIGTSILAVVDPLAFPSLLSRQRPDNLKYCQSSINPTDGGINSLS